MSQIHLETYTILETENLNTQFQPIRMKELSVITIYTQIASGHILLAVLSSVSVAIFSKVEKAPPFFFTYMFNDDVITQYTIRNNLALISSILEQASVKNIIFRLRPFEGQRSF